MIHAVRVTPDHLIDNVLDFIDVTALDAANMISTPFLWIGDADWATGQDPALLVSGNEWNGLIPGATFTAPPGDPSLPATFAEASAAVTAAAAALTDAIARQAVLTPTG